MKMSASVMMMMMMLVLKAIFLLLMIPHTSFATMADFHTSLTFCHSMADGLYSDPLRCDYFWKCWDDGLHGFRFLCPPHTLWNQASLSCDLPSHVNCTSFNSPRNSTAPIWSWNGSLSCFGYGCSKRGRPFAVGFSCRDAQELLTIARKHRTAWIAAPHEDGFLGSNHWKIKFDSINTNASGVTLMHVSVVDYSPSKMISSGWQGGPGDGEFALQGPLKSPQGCYYGLQLPNPRIWQDFAHALINETKSASPPPAIMHHHHRSSSSRSSTRRRRDKGSHQESVTIPKCLQRVPWADVAASALCYSLNFAGNNIGPCTNFSSVDLSSMVGCFQAVMEQQMLVTSSIP